MQDLVANITENLKDANRALQQENLALKAELAKLQEYIKVVENSDYTQELEERIAGLVEQLRLERESQKKIREDVEAMSRQLDELLVKFSTYFVDDETRRIYDLEEDRSLTFAINIDSKIIQNLKLEEIKNYLAALKCTKIGRFLIRDISTQKKSDLTLIGETFADYVRLANQVKGDLVIGLVQITMPDIFTQNAIVLRFYGNKNVSEDFEKFKQIYRKELRFEEMPEDSAR